MSENINPIELINFKPVPGGYVYRAPNPRIFGAAHHYLANESQKAAILAAITPRRPVLFQVALGSVFVAMVVAACALVWVTSGHDSPTARDIALIALLVTAQVLIGAQAMRWRRLRRLRPLLAGLPATDERITAAELREAMRKIGKDRQTITSVRQLLLIGIAQAVLSAVVFGLVALQVHAGRALDAGALAYLFAGLAIAISAACFLVAASRQKERAKGERSAANGILKYPLLQLLPPLVAVIGLAAVMVNIVQNSGREQKAAAIQSRLERLKVRIDESKVRATANRVHMTELTDRLNNPTVRCDAAPDDQACRQLAQREHDGARDEMAVTMAETDAIRQENAALQQELDAIHKELKANSR